MALELFGVFGDSNWVSNHQKYISDLITDLPSFRKKMGTGEFWLKSSSSSNPWDYDVRIFIKTDSIFIESSVINDVLHKDIYVLFNKLSNITNVKLLDDDGVPFNLK